MSSADPQPGPTRMFVGAGMRVGFFNMPFALLRVRADRLELMALLHIWRLAPDEVLAIEPARWNLLIGSGVRITHVQNAKPETLTFFALRPSSSVLAEIERVGFIPSGTVPAQLPADIEASVVRPKVLGAALFVVAGLMLLDHLVFPVPPPGQLSHAVTLGAALVFGASLAIRRPGRFRRFVMTVPEAPPRARWFLNFITLASGLVLFESLAARLGY